jgi:hypothetical protein
VGLAIYIATEGALGDVPGLGPNPVYGQAALRAFERLNELAAGLGLTPLNAFVSLNSIQSVDLLQTGADDWEERWFPAEDGLATLDGLLAHLRGHPRSALPDDARYSSAELVRDLEVMGHILAAARGRGVRFHLAADF